MKFTAHSAGFLCRRTARRLRKCRVVSGETGAIIIETALSFMLGMSLMLVVIECGLMAYTYCVIEDAAREGDRYASIHGTDSPTCSGPSTGCADSTAANVISDVKTYAQKFSGRTSGMTVTVTYPDGASTSTSRVQVAISYSYLPVFKLTGPTTMLNISSQGRIIY